MKLRAIRVSTGPYGVYRVVLEGPYHDDETPAPTIAEIQRSHWDAPTKAVRYGVKFRQAPRTTAEVARWTRRYYFESLAEAKQAIVDRILSRLGVTIPQFFPSVDIE